MDLVALAQQATNILAPALPFIYTGGIVAADKGKDMLIEGSKKVAEKVADKALGKMSDGIFNKAEKILSKLNLKKNPKLEESAKQVARDPEDPKALEDLQQTIREILDKNPELAREIQFTINYDIDFEIQNIGQFAMGNYNNFYNFESPSGEEYLKIIEGLEQKRKEASNQENLSRYNPSILPNYPQKLKKFVTQNRADELRKVLIYLENHRILLLSGVGGVGKSTLARAFIDLRPVDVPEPFWFDFNKNQSAKLGDILEKLASYLKTPEITSFKDERREPGKFDVDKLTDELHRRNQIWLIFDDLSTILEDQHFADKEIELLFSSLRYNTHNAKIIITSRILPILENGESLVDVVEDEEKQHLKGLESNFAVDYLAKNGLNEVEPEKLKELATGVDGHPLALKLLVELVKGFGVKDTLEDLSMYRERKDDTIKKARKLFDKLAGEEKELLERISVYREPVDMKGLKEMFTESTPKNSVRKLIDKSLLETDHNSSYWLHPLVQEFSYEDLKNKKEVHLIAYDYYKSLKPLENPTKKEGLQPAIEAHYHACIAGEYDLAASILWGFNIHYLLDLRGNQRTLIEMYEKLLPENHLKDEPILTDKQTHGAVLGNLGNAYDNLGDPKKAIECYEQALKIAREIGDRRGEENRLGNLGNTYYNLDEPRKAIEYYEQALKISIKIGDKRNEGYWLGNLGSAYGNLGDPKKTIEYNEQALKIARETGDRRGEGNHIENLGLAYSDLGEPKKAIEYNEQALIISREIGDRRGEGNRLRNLGLTYSDLGYPKKAIEFLKQSLAIGKEIEDPRIISFCEQKLKELEGSVD